ncbi:MAG TPA: zinc ABC transporter substrate-binding protein [Solirubrobacteraceae bacterium]|nr:zinc ABC transporter substrate-binding protein [Solirubrobacteraceae bacterium]
MRTSRLITPWLTTLSALTAAAVLAGCGISRAETNGVAVVAAENFWGSIATQIAGDKGTVQSIITNPAQDPHSYEPSANDARLLATSQLAIVNGVGYDPWAAKLLAANPDGKRVVLTVGSEFKLRGGDNPHRWYSPADVDGMAYYITAALSKLDPRNADYYAHRLATFETTDLDAYHRLISQIKRRYHGVPVGASESIFAPMAPALGLTLITPTTFMNAVSEGTEVSAQDTIATQDEIARHQIKVWIYNSQNATPQVQRLTAAARANHIPVVAITETLTPATASFQQWQVAQLERLERALHEATGR